MAIALRKNRMNIQIGETILKSTEYEFVDLIKAEPLVKESYTIDPKAHRKSQRAAKIRNLAQKGATEGERAAAERKPKVLRCLVKRRRKLVVVI